MPFQIERPSPEFNVLAGQVSVAPGVRHRVRQQPAAPVGFRVQNVVVQTHPGAVGQLAHIDLHRRTGGEAGAAATPLFGNAFASDAAERRLRETYGVASLNAFGSFERAEVAALGARIARPGRPLRWLVDVAQRRERHDLRGMIAELETVDGT